MKLYFDMNIYNRLFDDQNQLRIRFESMAIDVIFEIIEKKQHSLVWSFMLEHENKGNPYPNRRGYIKILSGVCSETIEPNPQIKELANKISKESNAKPKDSLHLACAVFSKCECFLTCDDRFIKTINANYEKLKDLLGDIKIMNPIIF
jgi:hypothetical protein